jgi:PAS domain S-box-containing protein
MMLSADERSRSEEALRKSEERYRLVAKATSDVIWDWDLRTGEVLWSDAVSRAFGYALGSIEPTFAWWSGRLHPEDSPRVEASMRAAIDGGRSSWSDEHRFQRSDGEYATVLDRGFIARDDDGRPVRMVGTMLDITARKKVEVEMLRADRLAAVGTLAAGVAHEINNPLAYIAGNVGYVREQLARMRDPIDGVVQVRGTASGAARRRRGLDEVYDALTEAYEGAGRIRQIVRDLKLFARGDDGGSGPTDVQRVLESSINMANNEIRHRAVLVKDYRPVPLVEGSESRLGQVFLNLLINAAHAIKEGSVASNEIRVGTDLDPIGRVIVTVRDTGAGISPELMSRIFDPFFTTKPVGIGTGLGLSICHGIIADLGGEIRVGSAPDRGTIFTVTLPMHRPRPEPELRVTAPSSRPTSAPSRVLVIDDEPSLGRALTRMLAHEHEVVVALSGREGLACLLEDESFDPVLCDLMMPDMSGIELYEELLEARPHIAERIIFMTGGAFTPRAREFLESVPNLRLEKPFDLETLRDAVQRRLM